jgi:hypothetical protein
MRIRILITLMTVTLFATSCRNQPKQVKASVPDEGNDIEVYYFHMTNRCTTCLTIESESRKNIEMFYPVEVSSGKVNFTSLNIEEDAGKSVGDEFNVKGQTLLIVKGEKKVDLTKEAFLYAEGNPDKFASVIKAAVDSLLQH